MLRFPNAKINLGLTVLRKRADGFHDLDTVFHPIGLQDVLEFIPAKDTTLTIQGVAIPGDPNENLVWKAYQLLKQDFPALPPLSIILEKHIPTGSGLGGGSSDAVFIMQMLNDAFELNCSSQQLHTYALQLGSDCPFFLLNQTAHAGGRGEILTPLSVNLQAYFLILICPGIHVPTREAFQQVSIKKETTSTATWVQQDLHTWRDHLYNDFEPVVCRLYPALAGISQTLYDAGAVYASMSGSGSSFYGFFERNRLDAAQLRTYMQTCYPQAGVYLV